MKTLFKNIGILDADGFRTGNVVVEGKQFQSITEEIPDQTFDEVVDGKNRLLIPGLINAHTHASMTLMRGYGGGLPLMEWLTKKIFPVEDKMDDEDAYYGTELGLCEMLATGTTMFTDMYLFTDPIAEVVIKSGMKANLSRCLSADDPTIDVTKERRVVASKKFFEDYHMTGDGRVQVEMALHAVYSSFPRYAEYAAELAKTLGARMHIHLSETVGENEGCMSAYHKTPTEYMNDLGLFDVPCIAAHGVYLTDNDRKILSEKGVSIVLNPTSNLKLGSGIAKAKEMLDAGINVALGTDGASSNNNLNMFEEMHIASLITGDPSLPAILLPSEQIFAFATVNGAKAMGRENTGKIQEGYAADFCILDIDKPHLQPVHSMMENLIYSAQGSDVERTYVDGKCLYKNGEFLTIDYERTKFEVNKRMERLFG